MGSDRWKLLYELGVRTGGAFKGFGGLDSDIDFGKVISGLFDNSSPEEVSNFIKSVIQKTVVQPAHIKDSEKYELHFAEYFHHNIDIFACIFDQNYGKTIDRIKKKLFQLGLFTWQAKESSSPEKEKKNSSKK